MRKSKMRRTESKRRVPIDKLLAYWIDLSKRRTLTPEDLCFFFRMTEATFQYLAEYYHDTHLIIEQDKFLSRVSYLPFLQEGILKKVAQSGHLAARDSVVIKDTAKKFIPRIRKFFGQRLALS